MKADTVIVISSIKENKYFFSNDLCQNHGKDDSYISTIYYLPMEIVDMQNCVIETVEEIISIFYKNMIRLRNPDINLEPCFEE